MEGFSGPKHWKPILNPFPKSYNRLGLMKLADLFGSNLCEFCHTLMCKFHVQFYFISVNGWIQVRREPRRAPGQIAGESLRMIPVQLPKINRDSDQLHLKILRNFIIFLNFKLYNLASGHFSLFGATGWFSELVFLSPDVYISATLS